MTSLNLKVKSSEGQTLDVNDHFMVSFGRDSSSDLIVKDKQVSKLHGEFYVVGNQLMIRDIGSRNGTFVNGKRINDECPLKANDVIHLGTSPIFKIFGSQKNESSKSQMKLAPVPAGLWDDDHPDSSVALSAAQDAPLTLKRQETQVSAPVSVPSPPSEKPKSNKLILMVLGGVVTLLFLWSMFMPKQPATPPVEVYNESSYLRDLDSAVNAFAKKDYQNVIDSLQQPIQKFSQNHAAHILSSLAEIWRLKGDQYEHLEWHEAEDLCKELLDIHPNTPATTQLAQNLLTWIKKEEPNMAQLQNILGLGRQEKWDLAYKEFKTFPSDSRFNTTHGNVLTEMATQYKRKHQEAYQKAVEQHRWSKALSELDMLIAGPQPPLNHEELKNAYLGYILDQTNLSQGKFHLEKKSFILCQEALGNIDKNSPYYEEAQRTIALTS
jgi:hypothetical protein